MSLQLLIRPLISSLQIFARVIYHVVAFPQLGMAVQIPPSFRASPRCKEARGNPLDLDREQQAARSRRVSRRR